MTSLAFQKMRMLSHAYIRRQLDLDERRSRLQAARSHKRRTCKYNAHSAFLLCAVNPSGPCSQCLEYEPREKINLED